MLRKLDCLHDVPIKYVTSTTGSRDSHGTHTQCQVSDSSPVVDQLAKKYGNRTIDDTLGIYTTQNAPCAPTGSAVDSTLCPNEDSVFFLKEEGFLVQV